MKFLLKIQVVEVSATNTAASWEDYLELTKPRVVALMILTALIGMCMAVPGFVPWQPLVLGNVGIALCAGAAAAINHIVDERIDQRMSRTEKRPVANGRIAQSPLFSPWPSLCWVFWCWWFGSIC